MTASPRTPTRAVSPAPDLLVASPALQRTLDDAARVAGSGCHVLVLGERGVGKELLARFIHKSSGREGQLIAVNCATIQPALAESILFGHARGAFTGAMVASRGLVRSAEGGTLFLDEVGELPIEVQARLLRLLQEGVVQPVGEAEQRVNVRIVAATNRDLGRAAREGQFREDLRDRLHQVALRLAPLRERRAEILPLAERFLRTAAELEGRTRPTLSAGARAALRGHDWPGNVRELRNVVVGAALLSGREVLSAREIRRALSDGPAPGSTDAEPRGLVAVGVHGLEPDRSYAIAELVGLFGLPRGTVKRRVAELVARGALVAEGAGRGRTYRRASPVGGAPETKGPRGDLAARIVETVRALQEASTGALAEILKVSRATVKRVVQQLCAAGRVERVGASRGTRVRVVEPPEEKGPPPAQPRTPESAVGSAPELAAIQIYPEPAPTPTETRQAAQEALALTLAARQGATTARELAAALGQTNRTAERVLARLSASGRLRPDGFARARRYLLSDLAETQQQLKLTRGATKTTARARPEAPAGEPTVAVNGRPLPLGLLRLALTLASAPGGASLSQLASTGRVREADARALLNALVGVGLLHMQSGPQVRWRLCMNEAREASGAA